MLKPLTSGERVFRCEREANGPGTKKIRHWFRAFLSSVSLNFQKILKISVASWCIEILDERTTEMQIEFSLVYTPLSMWDFCSIAKISPLTYHRDLLKGLISRSCVPYLADRPSFRCSNFADLVAYNCAKFILPGNWSLTSRVGISDRFVDSMLSVFEYQEISDCHDVTYSQFLGFLCIDDLVSELKDSGIQFSRINDEILELTLEFAKCWEKSRLEFARIIEVEEEMEFKKLHTVQIN